MPYSVADESFTHQLPRPFDTVHYDDPSWSDRCYFYAAAPDGSLLIATGYGNSPITHNSLGYGKVALADGRHWDLTAGRPVTGADRGDLYAGPMRWTCADPLKHWLLEVGPNPSGIEWELNYEPRAPMWELKPVSFRGAHGRQLTDMYHMKESGRWSGWIRIEGERISVDGFHGGRDRTFGVRAADQIDFWIWIDAGFDDKAIQAWLFETSDGTVQYVDGGITHTNGMLSKRFVEITHDIEFDGAYKRPLSAALTLTDEDGVGHRVVATSPVHGVNAYYGLPLPSYQQQSLSGGQYFGHFAWDSSNQEELRQVEARAMAVDQLMQFESNGQTGSGVFEVLCAGAGYERYPNCHPIDFALLR
jgi:hypothetical protein